MNEKLAILGVSRTSTKAEVKQAYKRLAQQHHPDRSHDNGEKFKQVKAAYDFILKNWDQLHGASSSTSSPPRPDPTAWNKPKYNQYGGAVQEVHKIKVDFTQIFGNTVIKIPNTMFYFKVPYGVTNGSKSKVLARTFDNAQQAYFDVEHLIADPTGFYSTKVINGVVCLYCKVPVTIGMVQSGFNLSIRNINTAMSDIQLTLTTDKLIKVEGCGLPNKDGRGDLYVEPVIEIAPLEDEIFPVLVKLQKKIDELVAQKVKEGERRVY